MAYLNLSDINEAVNVTADDINYANTYVENLLKNMKVDDPSQIQSEYLKELAKLVALERACVRLSQTEDSVYLEKAKAYRRLREELERDLTPRTLNLESTTSYLSAPVGRA